MVVQADIFRAIEMIAPVLQGMKAVTPLTYMQVSSKVFDYIKRPLDNLEIC